MIVEVLRKAVAERFVKMTKDSVLSKSMLAFMHQWIEKMQNEHVNYDDEEVNPFKKLKRKVEKEQVKDTSFMNIKVS